MNKWPWFLVSMLVIFCDQASKYWALSYLSLYQAKPIAPMINFTLAYNTGAAFSFLSGAGEWHRWFFASFSFIMSIILVVWIVKLKPKAYLQHLSLSLILGGALGNLIDRAVYGYVIDFIDVYYKHYHWPVFNLADSAICIGAFLLFVDLVKNKEDNEEASKTQ